jgi:hypothetical protein
MPLKAFVSSLVIASFVAYVTPTFAQQGGASGGDTTHKAGQTGKAQANTKANSGK